MFDISMILKFKWGKSLSFQASDMTNYCVVGYEGKLSKNH